MNRVHALAGLALVLLGAEGVALAQETFNHPMATWSNTIFVSRWPAGGTFWKDPFAGDTCIPGGAVPIAQGGDKEGAYSNLNAQPREAYALVDTGVVGNDLVDSSTSMFVHLCPAPATNLRTTVGLAGRIQLNAAGNPIQSYMAVLNCPAGFTDVNLYLIRDLNANLDSGPVDGLIDTGDILAGPVRVGDITTNYFLELVIAGGNLTASAATQTAAGRGPITTLIALDMTIAHGFNGVIGYAPFNNRVYYDDVAGMPGAGGGAGLVCSCDFNGDGVFNSADFFAFLVPFLSGEPVADFYPDTVIDSRDLFAFLDCLVGAN